jgi:hypothetical protein
VFFVRKSLSPIKCHFPWKSKTKLLDWIWMQQTETSNNILSVFPITHHIYLFVMIYGKNELGMMNLLMNRTYLKQVLKLCCGI